MCNKKFIYFLALKYDQEIAIFNSRAWTDNQEALMHTRLYKHIMGFLQKELFLEHA